MEKDYILLKFKYDNGLLKHWVVFNYENKKSINEIERLLKFNNGSYIILYNIENKYDYDNDCYYLDKVWKKLFEDYYMED